MALLGEVTAEIIQKHESTKAKAGVGLQQLGASLVEKPKPKRRQKTLADMTPAEVEAFRQRKMQEEEARVLGKPVDTPKNQQKRRGTQIAKTPVKKPVKAKKADKPAVQAVRKPSRKTQSPKMPKMLQPLTPLYLLKIPGLPEGDCLAICYVKGAT